jgi:hypothetical protein
VSQNVPKLGRVWRRVGIALFLTAFAGWIWSGGLYYQYQGTLPRHPDPATGSIYPLNIHGVVVYQTLDERDHLDEVQYSSIAIFAASALIAVVYRKKFEPPPTLPSIRPGSHGFRGFDWLNTSAISPAPDLGRTGTPPGRVLWKLSLAVTAVRQFHQQLNAGEFEEIYGDADQGFRATQGHDQLVKFLGVVHKKLGNAGDGKQINFRVDTNEHGTFVTAWYATTFDNGAGSERFTWVKDRGVLKLYEYHIDSNAFLAN